MSPRTHPLGGIVNPMAGYSHEPAPMGIADFGVTGPGAGARAYSYTASAFEGTAQIRSMSVTVGSSSNPPVTAFELNAVLVLQLDGANYSYWIQNGLHVNTATREFTIGGAYVWNFSAPGARLTSAEVQGNTSSLLATDTYYFIPGCGTFAGQCSTLAWPSTLTGRISAATVNGDPTVAYQYDLGTGWVTYDTVAFPGMAGAVVSGFLVDGYSPAPYAASLLYDAEWVWVGAGGGSSSRDLNSDLGMSLAYWNGHNYQETPTAWNFGGDTGETATNVTETLDASGASGALAAHVASGSGTLGVVYNGTSAGFLDVESPAVPQGAILVDGLPAVFQGGSANFTLAPGTYVVSLQNYSNATGSVRILAGEATSLDFSRAGWTTFSESGLPLGTLWSLSVGGLARSSNRSTLSFTLPNGTYPIAYFPVAGYYRSASDPVELSVPVPSMILVDWNVFTYRAVISESGLPEGVAWWVNLSGQLMQGSAAAFAVSVPNGSTPFSVGSSYEFLATPTVSSINVTAGVVSPVGVQFSYRPTFIAGTVNPSNATVRIGGVVQILQGGNFDDSVIPGSYTIVASAPGYATQTIPVNATAGNTTVQQIDLSPAYPPSSPAPASGGGTDLWPWIALGVVAAAVLGAVVVVLLRRRSTSR